MYSAPSMGVTAMVMMEMAMVSTSSQWAAIQRVALPTDSDVLADRIWLQPTMKPMSAAVTPSWLSHMG